MFTEDTFEAELKAGWEAREKLEMETKPALQLFKCFPVFKVERLPESIYLKHFNDFFGLVKSSLLLGSKWKFTGADKEQTLGAIGGNRFLINRAPLFRYHSLFLPFFGDELPQDITATKHLMEAIKLLGCSKSPDFKLYFNSYGGGATINHLHFHVMFGDSLLKGLTKIPIENAIGGIEILSLTTPANIKVYANYSYPLSNFCFKTDITTIKDALKAEHYCRAILGLINSVNEEKQAYNILFSEQGTSIYVIPRKAQELGVVVKTIGEGCLECCGVGIAYDKAIYESLTSAELVAHLTKFSIGIEATNKIKDKFLALMTSK